MISSQHILSTQSANKKNLPLDKLPDDVINTIISYLLLVDHLAFATCSREIKRVADGNFCWKIHLLQQILMSPVLFYPKEKGPIDFVAQQQHDLTLETTQLMAQVVAGDCVLIQEDTNRTSIQLHWQQATKDDMRYKHSPTYFDRLWHNPGIFTRLNISAPLFTQNERTQITATPNLWGWFKVEAPLKTSLIEFISTHEFDKITKKTDSIRAYILSNKKIIRANKSIQKTQNEEYRYNQKLLFIHMHALFLKIGLAFALIPPIVNFIGALSKNNKQLSPMTSLLLTLPFSITLALPILVHASPDIMLVLLNGPRRMIHIVISSLIFCLSLRTSLDTGYFVTQSLGLIKHLKPTDRIKFLDDITARGIVQTVYLIYGCITLHQLLKLAISSIQPYQQSKQCHAIQLDTFSDKIISNIISFMSVEDNCYFARTASRIKNLAYADSYWLDKVRPDWRTLRWTTFSGNYNEAPRNFFFREKTSDHIRQFFKHSQSRNKNRELKWRSPQVKKRILNKVLTYAITSPLLSLAGSSALTLATKTPLSPLKTALVSACGWGIISFPMVLYSDQLGNAMAKSQLSPNYSFEEIRALIVPEGILTLYFFSMMILPFTVGYLITQDLGILKPSANAEKIESYTAEEIIARMLISVLALKYYNHLTVEQWYQHFSNSAHNYYEQLTEYAMRVRNYIRNPHPESDETRTPLLTGFSDHTLFGEEQNEDPSLAGTTGLEMI